MWRIKKKFKKILYQITGLTLYKKLPFGLDPFDDLRHQFKDYSFDTFFDVGANIGQSAIHIRKAFPKAKIWCFEPVNETFQILKTNTAHQNVNCFQMGLGNQTADLKIYIDKEKRGSSMNSLINKKNSNSSTQTKEIIKILTVFLLEKNLQGQNSKFFLDIFRH